ncbi:exo-beta 1,3 glucanase-like protein [Bimuria novae-zelandiae CBS 107.79]|uniref:Exo-beta 1,3 glucanase-like protein n=1 Tax=Bimuria novae-zelandiae CBS 107.79 TaxID=1447943 RepID=A0A6A5VMK3_9PLEO|nr:exo-beta 1,3 glucanase-like protein [Bimuria novae-zelandiae CBS 107.79]
MHILSFLSCLLAVGGPTGALPSPLHASSAPETHLEERQTGSYWLETIQKQGRAAFNPSPASYKVFRNVKDYGAKGDGVTDDSAAINAAIKDGNRCGPWVCESSTDTPALVYFPSGTYVIAKPIIMYYMTQLHGNANDRPVLKASPSLQALALIDASPYQDGTGAPGWTSTNVFARQIRNFVIDLTPIPATSGAQGIHWPASQATSIQNVKIQMNVAANSVHAGIFIENGSGGHLTDIETVGGKYGLNVGNQQFTMKNIKISNAVVGISQIWNWGWLWKGLTISDCGTAFSMTSLKDNQRDQNVASVIIIDSTITNCPVFVDSAWTRTSSASGAGQLILENIALNNVPVAVKGPSGTVLAGGTTTIRGWGQGNKYSPDGPTKFQGDITPNRPAGLLNGDKYYARSKPQYQSYAIGNFVSARTSGAKGDGSTDDTTALQNAINSVASSGKVLFLDHGHYKITRTLYIPPGTRIVGETFPIILASGSTWGSKTNAVPVVQIGKAGESGTVELSDFLIGTQGPTPGAKLIEYNLASTKGSGLWDVHTRIGGAKGTNLQVAQCPVGSVNDACMAAHTNVHITKSASNVYMENNWFWTADHDLDDAKSTQISIFVGRGLLVEGSNIWLYGNGVEHQSLYQYQFANAKDVFAGFIQSETPYYMPTPDAKSQPYPRDNALFDPDYNVICPAGQRCDALGLRVLNSSNVLLYGAGFYSFFISNNNSCSKDTNAVRDCQNRIVSIEGSSTVLAYSLNQVGALQMLTIDGVDKADWTPNLSGYANTIGYLSYKS